MVRLPALSHPDITAWNSSYLFHLSLALTCTGKTGVFSENQTLVIRPHALHLWSVLVDSISVHNLPLSLGNEEGYPHLPILWLWNQHRQHETVSPRANHRPLWMPVQLSWIRLAGHWAFLLGIISKNNKALCSTTKIHLCERDSKWACLNHAVRTWSLSFWPSDPDLLK